MVSLLIGVSVTVLVPVFFTHNRPCALKLAVLASIKVTATSVDINGMTSVSVKAAKVDVTTPVATFSGIVRCEMLQANASVASPVYSPGVCNLL